MAVLIAQALVEYGALNSAARDATAAANRAGDWARDNPLIIAGVVLVLIVVLRRR